MVVARTVLINKPGSRDGYKRFEKPSRHSKDGAQVKTSVFTTRFKKEEAKDRTKEYQFESQAQYPEKKKKPKYTIIIIWTTKV